ncbi:MAG: hypothetical protein AAFO01_08870 [Pseudomonadota bacterium]
MTCRLFYVLVAVSFTACAEAPPIGGHSTLPNDFGLAVKSNMAAQIIADEGEVRSLGPAPGERRAVAVGRYQTDRVEKPAKIYTRDE